MKLCNENSLNARSVEGLDRLWMSVPNIVEHKLATKINNHYMHSPVSLSQLKVRNIYNNQTCKKKKITLEIRT